MTNFNKLNINPHESYYPLDHDDTRSLDGDQPLFLFLNKKLIIKLIELMLLH